MSNTTIGPIDIEFLIKDGALSGGFTKLKQEIAGVTGAAKQEAGKAGNAFKSGFGGVEKVLDGIGLSAGALAGPAAAIGAAFKFKQLAQEALDFENAFGMAMREVQTISTATQENFDGMSKAIVDMAANGPDDAITLAKAYYQIASAGHDGAAGLDLLSVASKASVAGVTDTMTAADGLTTVINAWGLSSDQANSVADAMFKTVERGKTTFSQLASSISQVAPLAAANNISFNEIFAALQTITKQGTPTAQAMTQIRSSIINMNNALGDGWSETMTYQEGLNKISEMAGGSQVALKKLIPDVEGMSAVLAMTGEKAQGAADDLNETAKAAGAMETAYGRMMQEADNQWAVVHNKWTREIREFGKALKAGSSDIAYFFDQMLTDRKVDIIDPGAKAIIDGVSSSISGLNDKEAKLAAIIDKINELKKKRVDEVDPIITKLEKSQPNLLTKAIGKVAAGQGNAGLYSLNRANTEGLTYYQQQADIISAAEKGLNELYQKTLNQVVKPDKAGAEAKMRTLKDIETEIAEAKKNQDGVGSKAEYDALQRKIDLLETEKTAITGAKSEEKKAIDEVAAAREALRKAIIDNNSTEADIQAKKIVLLEAEKKKLEDLIALRIYNAKYANDIEQVDGVSMKPMTSIKNTTVVGSTKIEAGVLYEVTAVDKTGPVWKKVKAQFGELKKFEKEQNENGAKEQEKLDEETADKKKRNLQNLIDYSRQFTGELISQLDLGEQQADQINALADVIANLAAGDYMAALFAGMSQTFSDTKNAELATRAFARQLEIVNELLADNDRILGLSGRTGGKSEVYSERMILLKKQQELNQQQVEATKKALEIAKVEKNSSLFGQIFGSTKDEEKALEDAQLALKKTQQDIEDTQLAWNDFLRGGLTENTIADAITEGFKQGKTSVDDFAEYVNTMLYDAVIQVFKAELLGPEMTKISEYVKAALIDNTLSSTEIDDVNKMTQALIEKNKPLWEQLTQNLNLGSSVAAQAMTGIAASATEDSVSAMVGQLMAVRVDIKDILKSMDSGREDVLQSLMYLKEIAGNTSHNVKLVSIETELKEMNRVLKDKL